MSNCSVFCVDLFFNKNESKAIFMEKNCDRFAKNCRNEYPRIFISLIIRAVCGNLRWHLTEAAIIDDLRHSFCQYFVRLASSFT